MDIFLSEKEGRKGVILWDMLSSHAPGGMDETGIYQAVEKAVPKHI